VPCARLLTAAPRWRFGRVCVSPRLDVPIVHFVPDAAISKFIVKEGIVGEPRRCPLRNRPRTAVRRADGFFIGSRSGSIGLPEDVNKSTESDEAGGNAMRRPPDVGQAALYIGLLLGVSGCAGFPQQTTGSSPWTTGSEGENASPPGLFSWWHRSGTQAGTASSTPTGMQETAGASQRYSEASQSATSPWPETRSEWVARNFPRFNRLWNGTPEGMPPPRPDAGGVTWTNRLPEKSPADERAVATSDPRSDGAIRPTDGAAAAAADAGEGRAGSRGQSVAELPFSQTPPPVRSPRQSDSEPAAPAGSETSAPMSSPISWTDSTEPNDGAQRVSFQPQAAPAATQTAGASGGGSTADESASSPSGLEDILPAPALAGPQEPAAAAIDGSRATRSATGVPAARGSASRAEPPASLDTRMAQVPPPPPPPVQRTPKAPSPPGGNAPETSPPPPPASPAATSAATEKTNEQAPAAAPATTAPVAAESKAPATGSGGRLFAASGQSMYAPPPPMAPAQPRHHFLSWLFHDDDSAVLASGQAPLAAAPTAYSSPQNGLPTGQGGAADCEADGKAPKKPCFLKVWIHDLKNGHGFGGDDCGHGGICASAQTNAAPCDSGVAAPKKPCFLKVWIHDWKNSHGCGANDCGPGGVHASAQANATACVAAPKKPCFLKVWIHDWKNGHGSGCGGCQDGVGSCCRSGKCCGGGMGVTGSAQGGIASAQSSAAR
jgi:hypothetical protein